MVCPIIKAEWGKRKTEGTWHEVKRYLAGHRLETFLS